MRMRIRKYVDDGADVIAISATQGEYADSLGGRLEEEQRAAQILGLKKIINLSLPCARLSENVVTLRTQLEKLIKEIKPDIGYTIFPYDLHVDHEIVAHQSLTALRSVPELIYYKVAYSRGFNPNLFFFGNKRLLDIKIKALNCFSSELKKA